MRWKLIAAGSAAAVVLLGVVVAGVAEASSNAPTPSPFTQVITDSNTIKQAQTLMNVVTANNQWNGPAYGPPNDQIDGNASNPDFKNAVSYLQQGINARLNTGALPYSQLPKGFPSQLRTDGVLDYATYIAMVNA